MGCGVSKNSTAGGGGAGAAAAVVGLARAGGSGGGGDGGDVSPGASGGGDLRYNMLKANKGARFHELFEVCSCCTRIYTRIRIIFSMLIWVVLLFYSSFIWGLVGRPSLAISV